ncbi:hypothetical protein COLO4_09444 [Corchorus olitorius]|uniref:Uncharacterized protein n=1 Tax=Corchorus olitorius TaxID=93759 RepID=A0A1R3KC31_9ROSI|nr:hypothetical protein COLO4_09444 [Corchorus olitorius]
MKYKPKFRPSPNVALLPRDPLNPKQTFGPDPIAHVYPPEPQTKLSSSTISNPKTKTPLALSFLRKKNSRNTKKLRSAAVRRPPSDEANYWICCSPCLHPPFDRSDRPELSRNPRIGKSQRLSLPVLIGSSPPSSGNDFLLLHLILRKRQSLVRFLFGSLLRVPLLKDLRELKFQSRHVAKPLASDVVRPMREDSKRIGITYGDPTVQMPHLNRLAYNWNIKLYNLHVFTCYILLNMWHPDVATQLVVESTVLSADPIAQKSAGLEESADPSFDDVVQCALVVSAMVNNDLISLVNTRPLKFWKEILALLCTVYFGLLVFVGYMVVDSLEIIEKAHLVT